MWCCSGSCFLRAAEYFHCWKWVVTSRTVCEVKLVCVRTRKEARTKFSTTMMRGWNTIMMRCDSNHTHHLAILFLLKSWKYKIGAWIMADLIFFEPNVNNSPPSLLLHYLSIDSSYNSNNSYYNFVLMKTQ